MCVLLAIAMGKTGSENAKLLTQFKFLGAQTYFEDDRKLSGHFHGHVLLYRMVEMTNLNQLIKIVMLFNT